MPHVLVLLGGLLIPILVGLPGFGPGNGETTTSTTSIMDGGDAIGSGEPGDPCDPETYDGPYRCIEDPGSDGQYVIAD